MCEVIYYLLFEVILASSLTILFTSLKLMQIIHWPWIWILAPFWIYLLILFMTKLLFNDKDDAS